MRVAKRTYMEPTERETKRAGEREQVAGGDREREGGRARGRERGRETKEPLKITVSYLITKWVNTSE